MVWLRLGRSVMKVKTIKSEQVWQSPDKQRTIWQVSLLADDKEYTLKTYSEQIGTVGYEGDVVSYKNDRGDRFVKSASDDSKPYSRDDLAIRAQWAIGQAINLASVKMDKEAITLPVIVTYAKELFAAVNDVKGIPMTDEKKEAGDNLINGFAGN